MQLKIPTGVALGLLIDKKHTHFDVRIRQKPAQYDCAILRYTTVANILDVTK